MKKYKYIIIEQRNEELFERKPVYRIFNKRSKDQIGILSYYKPWKEYVFSSQPECVFNNTCLHDVIDFLENEISK
jgi:hypothetical protein